MNYDIVSSNKGGPDQWFENANFSVIDKNPRGSEFIDVEYEDERIYESRELGYTPPQIIDSAGLNKERKILYHIA